MRRIAVLDKMTDRLLDRLDRQMPDWLVRLELRILMRLTAAACGQRPPALWGKSAAESLAAYRAFTVRAVSSQGNEIRAFREAMYRKAWRIGRLLALLPGLHDRERKKRLVILLYRNIDIEIEAGGSGSCMSQNEECKGGGCVNERNAASVNSAGESSAADGAVEKVNHGDEGVTSGSIVASVNSADESSIAAQRENEWRIRIPHCSFSGAYTPRTCYVMSGLDAGIICGIFGGGKLAFEERLTEGCPACSAVHQLG